jgi:protein involved in polysaccharide export with SLBB domain
MRIVGGKSVVEEVNLQRILDGGSLAADLALSEGDVISIPAGEASVVYLTGRVSKPGSFHLTYGEKLMAYAAILQNGGFGRFADLRKAYVLRNMRDGTKTRVSLDVVAIQKGQRPDVLLQSNDIIVVPEKFFSF